MLCIYDSLPSSQFYFFSGELQNHHIQVQCLWYVLILFAVGIRGHTLPRGYNLRQCIHYQTVRTALKQEIA